MLLIVGLGNPGPEYAGNRHNVGFMAVDAIQRRHGFQPWRRRFSGETSEGTLGGERALLLKPTTFMNVSGRSVQEAAQFFKIAPGDIVVLHDDVDLPPGKTRVKTGGGAAGHNGLRSIDAAIGQGYRRLRIGVGHPGVRDAVPHYVLHDFSKEDRVWLTPLLDTIADNAALFAEGKDNTLANRLHAAAQPVPEKAAKGKDGAEEAKTSSKAKAAPPQSDEPAGGALADKLRKLFGL